MNKISYNYKNLYLYYILYTNTKYLKYFYLKYNFILIIFKLLFNFLNMKYHHTF